MRERLDYIGTIVDQKTIDLGPKTRSLSPLGSGYFPAALLQASDNLTDRLTFARWGVWIDPNNNETGFSIRTFSVGTDGSIAINTTLGGTGLNDVWTTSTSSDPDIPNVGLIYEPRHGSFIMAGKTDWVGTGQTYGYTVGYVNGANGQAFEGTTVTDAASGGLFIGHGTRCGCLPVGGSSGNTGYFGGDNSMVVAGVGGPNGKPGFYKLDCSRNAGPTVGTWSESDVTVTGSSDKMFHNFHHVPQPDVVSVDLGSVHSICSVPFTYNSSGYYAHHVMARGTAAHSNVQLHWERAYSVNIWESLNTLELHEDLLAKPGLLYLGPNGVPIISQGSYEGTLGTGGSANYAFTDLSSNNLNLSKFAPKEPALNLSNSSGYPGETPVTSYGDKVLGIGSGKFISITSDIVTIFSIDSSTNKPSVLKIYKLDTSRDHEMPGDFAEADENDIYSYFIRYDTATNEPVFLIRCTHPSKGDATIQSIRIDHDLLSL